MKPRCQRDQQAGQHHTEKQYTQRQDVRAGVKEKEDTVVKKPDCIKCNVTIWKGTGALHAVLKVVATKVYKLLKSINCNDLVLTVYPEDFSFWWQK